MKTSKLQQKTQKRLRELGMKNGKGHCWVCGSTSGLKMSREAYGTRCVKCISENNTNADVIEYDRLKKIITKTLGE